MRHATTITKLLTTSTLALLAVIPAIAACDGGDGALAAQEAPLVEGIRSMEKRPDGRFEVTCADGRIEVVTADQIRQDRVCIGQGGSHPPPSGGATARFTCNSSANLEISLVGDAGTEKRDSVNIGTFSRCRAAADTLNANRREVRRTVLLGVCDSSANLNRFSLTRAGDIQRLAAVNIGTFSGCDAQATDLNGPVADAVGEAGIGTFSCNSSANLEISVVGSAGTEKRDTVAIGTFSRCSTVASALKETRRDIRRTMLFGVCDSSANLKRFAVTPHGDLNPLAQINIGTFSGCEAQATDINRPVGEATGDASIGLYNCNSSANLEIGIVGNAGTENRASVNIGTFSRCNSIVETLKASRRDIRRTVLIGVCDSSANLNRFSVTARGDLQTLAPVSIGTFSGCDAQATDINQ
jgi:hypothetical protein